MTNSRGDSSTHMSNFASLPDFFGNSPSDVSFFPWTVKPQAAVLRSYQHTVARLLVLASLSSASCVSGDCDRCFNHGVSVSCIMSHMDPLVWKSYSLYRSWSNRVQLTLLSASLLRLQTSLVPANSLRLTKVPPKTSSNVYIEELKQN